MKLKGLNHINYFASDIERAKNFYTQILGLSLVFEAPHAFSVNIDENSWMIIAKTEREGSDIGRGSCVVLWVDDIHKTLEELQGQGVVVLKEIYKEPAGLFAAIADSEGNQIKLYEGPHG